MNYLGKVKAVVMMFILMLPIVGGVVTVRAEQTSTTDTVNIMLHKRQYDTTPTEIENNGKEPSEASLGGKPLAGVGFSVYNVTAYYHDLVSGERKISEEDAIAKITNEASGDILENDHYVAVQREVFTDELGKAAFTQLAAKTNGKDSVYVFVETTLPIVPTIIQKSEPMVVRLPVYIGEEPSELLQEIHLYPKNVIAKENTKTISSITDSDGNVIDLNEVDGQLNVTTGDIIRYAINVTLPLEMANVTSYQINDVATEGLELVNRENFVAVVGNERKLLTQEQQYLLIEPKQTTKRKNIFTFNLKVEDEVIRTLGAKQLTLYYDMMLTKEINPGELQANNVEIRINQETGPDITPPPTLVTGGHQFVKVDAHTGKTLEGAEFIVTQGDNYAVFENQSSTQEYVFTKWVAEKENATTLTTNKEGALKVKGLLDGNYQLVETKAPTGYVMLTSAIDFKVESNAYETSILTVENTPKGWLPSTGGKGMYVYLAIGLVVAGCGLIFVKRSQEETTV